MKTAIPRLLTDLGTLTARPSAFLVPVVFGAIWFVFDRATLNWHAIATLITWLMTIVIQRAEHRDTQAIHAKLDALIKSESGTSDELTRIDESEPEDIERARDNTAKGRG